jgi:hypothetical protein
MSSTHRVARALSLAVTCASLTLATPAPMHAQGAPDVKQQSAQITMDDIATQLGTKLSMRQNEEFGLGTNLTGTLTDPVKLAKLGISGMHEGARVSVIRIAPDKARVEVDEMDPVPVTKKVTLKLDSKGQLSLPAQ